MSKMFLSLMIILSLFLSGCRKESFSRYPSVLIPQLEEVDYLSLLSNENPEVVYNAIVYLGNRAEYLGKVLSDEKTDKNSAEYINALNTYKKIADLLSSSDTAVVAVSLRFLQLFSSEYKAKEELVKQILQIRSNNPLVQYEQISALTLIANKDSKVPLSILRQFLNNSSWVVSRSAYLLVDKLKNDQLRRELINKYYGFKDEKDKLLILTALKNQFSDQVADFLFAEELTTISNKIRQGIFSIIGNAKNQEKVLEWIDRDYDKIIAADGKYLFQHHISEMDEQFSCSLLSIFLKKGFVAEHDFFKQLNEKLESYKSKKDFSAEDKEKLNNLLKIEKAVLENKKLADQWKILKEKNDAFNAKLAKLQSEYDVITKEFAAKTDELFNKYNISGEKKQEYIKGILDSRDGLKDMLLNDEEITIEGVELN